ncbi:MAG: hypothetical protein KC621_04495 [Myxococcales bacterium]|nr:hypothetical protein [Myxococcales bacterium]
MTGRARWLVVAGVGVVGVLALAVGGWSLVVRPRLAGWAEQALGDTFDADVEIGGIGVDAFSAFPRVAVSVTSLRVSGREAFAGVDLLKAGPSRVEVDLASALGDTVEILGVRLADVALDVRVLPDGRSNLDSFLGAGGSSGGGTTTWSLSDVELTNLSVRYDDREAGRRAEVDGFRANVDGVVGATTRFDVTAGADRVDLTSGGVRYLADVPLEATLEVEQAPDGTLTLGDNRVTVSRFPLSFGGTVAPQAETTAFDLTFSAPDSSLAGLLSLLPGATASSLEGVRSSGTVAFDGALKGRWPAEGDTLPALDLTLRLGDASFRFPDQPVGLDGLGIDLSLRHPEGPARATEVDARSFQVTVADQTVKGHFSLRDPLGDPLVDAAVQGKLDLATFRSAWPALADSTPPAGKLDLDLQVKGRLSDFELSKAEAVTCKGKVRGRGVRYESEGWPDLMVETFEVDLTPTTWALGETLVSWPGSGTTWSGTLEQVLPWVIRGDTLRGKLVLKSKKLDLRPFQGDDTASETEAGAIAAVPTWVDLELVSAIDHLVTEVFTMDAVRGTIVVRDGAVRLDGLEASMLGGRVTLDGTYAAPDTSAADIDLQIGGIQLDLGQTFDTFATMDRLAPVLRDVRTRFDSGMTLQARLKSDGTPELTALASKGSVLPSPAKLSPPALAGLSSTVRQRDAQTVQIGGTRFGWEIDGGRMALVPATIQLGGRKAELSGSTGIVDQTLDLRIATAVPVDALKPKALPTPKGVSGPIDLVLTIGGTYAAPKLGVALGGVNPAQLVEEAVQEVVGDLIGEAERQGDALIAEAERAAQTLLTEAQAQARKLHQEAQKQSKRLTDEAGSNPIAQQAAKEAGKKLVDQADRAGDELVSQARKLGDKGVSEAKSKKKDLVDAARKKTQAR